MVKIFKNSVLLCSMKRSIHPVQFSGNCPTETHVRHVTRDRFLLLMFVFFFASVHEATWQTSKHLKTAFRAELIGHRVRRIFLVYFFLYIFPLPSFCFDSKYVSCDDFDLLCVRFSFLGLFSFIFLFQKSFISLCVKPEKTRDSVSQSTAYSKRRIGESPSAWKRWPHRKKQQHKPTTIIYIGCNYFEFSELCSVPSNRYKYLHCALCVW